MLMLHVKIFILEKNFQLNPNIFILVLKVLINLFLINFYNTF